MEWVETTGRTVQDALDAALDELGVDEDEAEFETLEEPKSGLFGKMRTEARIRARVRPTKPAAKEERRDKRRRPAADAVTEAVPDVETAPPGSTQPAPAVQSTPRAARARKIPLSPTAPTGIAVASAAVSTPGAQLVGGSHRLVDASDGVLREVADAAERFLQGVIDVLRLEAAVRSVVIDERTLQVEITGSELGFLIGPKAQTLMMLQELTRTIVHYQVGERGLRLMLDITGYRARRKVALEAFTKQLVDEVLSSGSARSLEPMSASDRKVVHDFVNTVAGVGSSSEGEEPSRYVVLSPA